MESHCCSFFLSRLRSWWSRFPRRFGSTCPKRRRRSWKRPWRRQGALWCWSRAARPALSLSLCRPVSVFPLSVSPFFYTTKKKGTCLLTSPQSALLPGRMVELTDWTVQETSLKTLAACLAACPFVLLSVYLSDARRHRFTDILTVGQSVKSFCLCSSLAGNWGCILDIATQLPLPVGKINVLSRTGKEWAVSQRCIGSMMWLK